MRSRIANILKGGEKKNSVTDNERNEEKKPLLNSRIKLHFIRLFVYFATISLN